MLSQLLTLCGDCGRSSGHGRSQSQRRIFRRMRHIRDEYQKSSCDYEFGRFIEGSTLPIGASSALSWCLNQHNRLPIFRSTGSQSIYFRSLQCQQMRNESSAARGEQCLGIGARLSAHVVECTECLKHWIKAGLLVQPWVTPEILNLEIKARFDNSSESGRRTLIN